MDYQYTLGFKSVCIHKRHVYTDNHKIVFTETKVVYTNTFDGVSLVD